MPLYHLEKYAVDVAFPRKNQNPSVKDVEMVKSPYLTYVRTSSRCANCGGVKNDVEQICEYCRNAQELPKIIRPLPPTVPLHEQPIGYYQHSRRAKAAPKKREKQARRAELVFRGFHACDSDCNSQIFS